MQFKKLVFQEIDDNRTQAAVSLDCDYKIQIIFDGEEQTYEGKLYDGKGSLVDSEEGMDKSDVEGFIDRSEDLVEKYKEIMEDCLELT